LFDTVPLSGTYSFTVPTDAGSLHFSGHITDARISVLDTFDLTQSGARFTGTAAVVPIVGTCVTPVTDVLITMVGSFKPAPVTTPAVPTTTATAPPTDVLGSSSRRQPALPVTGPTANTAFLALVALLCYLLGGFAVTWSRRRS
jgi:LPXTG-motif cell wall-anchored protein